MLTSSAGSNNGTSLPPRPPHRRHCRRRRRHGSTVLVVSTTLMMMASCLWMSTLAGFWQAHASIGQPQPPQSQDVALSVVHDKQQQRRLLPLIIDKNIDNHEHNREQLNATEVDNDAYKEEEEEDLEDTEMSTVLLKPHSIPQKNHQSTPLSTKVNIDNTTINKTKTNTSSDAAHHRNKDNTNNKKKEETICICVIQKNEDVYLDDWLDYHLNAIGFDHVFIYDNGFVVQKNTTTTTTVQSPPLLRLKTPWKDDHRVSIIPWPSQEITSQIHAYNHCARHMAQPSKNRISSIMILRTPPFWTWTNTWPCINTTISWT